MSVADYSAGPISATALRSAGITGVVRYVTLGSASKRITAAELQALRAGGTDVALVAEQDARTLASSTWDAAAAARAVKADCSRLAFTGAVYQAADWDVQASEWPRVRDHLRQIIGVMGLSRVGLYGPWDALEWAHRDLGITLLWQSMSTAHSGGRNAHQHPRAVLWQRKRSTVGGVSVDLNDILAPYWGQEDTMDKDTEFYLPGTWTELTRQADGGVRLADVVGYLVGTVRGLASDVAALKARPAAVALTDADRAAIAAQINVPTPADNAAEIGRRITNG